LCVLLRRRLRGRGAVRRYRNRKKAVATFRATKPRRGFSDGGSSEAAHPPNLNYPESNRVSFTVPTPYPAGILPLTCRASPQNGGVSFFMKKTK
jgi:hypothetical protein